MNDEGYMRLALTLAQKGKGRTSPNPMVGAVIVKDGRIIGQGFHEKYGEAHAERNALRSCTESCKGATMYVTLEPCCHYGKQPPCTDAIIEAGISRVVIGSSDPNPLVAGKGIDILKNNGICVTENVLADQCDHINEIFFHYITAKRPLVIMKYAMTLDGKIAAYTGLSKWITGEAARAHVHQQRNYISAIMAGIGTVISDDPLLTCRIDGGRDPARIICDTHLSLPLTSKIVSTAETVPTYIATCCSDTEKHKPYIKKGCRIIVTGEKDGHVDLNMLMDRLGEEKIDSLLLEGGGSLNWAALTNGIVDRVQAYVAPKLFGGSSAKTPVEGRGVKSPQEAIRLKNLSVTPLGEDFLIEGEVIKPCSQA